MRTNVFLMVLSLVFVVQGGGVVFADDALEEVNQYRASIGLPPFQKDEGLSKAAADCAEFRAQHLIRGHTRSDFAFLPSGCNADAAGCAAWPPSLGWGSCCSRERWRYAGAAWAMGRDGQRYMQLFVRNSPPPSEYRWERVRWGWVYMKGDKQVGAMREGEQFHWLNDDGTWSEGQDLQ